MATDPTIDTENPIEQELSDIVESEEMTPDNLDPADPTGDDQVSFEVGADADAAVPAELEAMHTDNESAHQAEGESVEDEQPSDKKKGAKVNKKVAHVAQKAKVSPRSKAYMTASEKIDPKRRYKLADALKLAKETSKVKFDAALELHVRMQAKKKADAERFRALVSLPHGTGKEPKIGVLDEAMIEQIKQKGDTEFDILIASPDLMPKVAQIAKVLGPKGKMPNPKTGTVTADPEAAKREILSGRVEMRADAQNIIHQVIGRVSYDDAKLMENAQAVLGALPIGRVQSITLAATMGPGIQIDLTA